MSRVKTFDATGIPPGGRLFAGDMNSIQDHYADAANFAQTIDLAVLRVGDTAIQFLKFGTGEARLTAALRTDGILRGLGGVFTGAYTTAQRDAIAAGFRPYTLLIFNTTTNRFEWNAGTDAAPNWQPVSDSLAAVPIGATMDWPWASGSLPSNYLLPYGQAVSRTTYAALHALASAASYPWGNGDGSTTFNLPDYRGRIGLGKDDMGGTAANRVTTGGSGINAVSLGASGGAQNIVLATGELPAHSHTLVAATVTGTPALSGNISNGSLGIARTGDVAVSNPAAWNVKDGGSGYGRHYYSDGGDGVDPTFENFPQGAGITAQPTFGLTGGVSNGSLGVNANTLDVGGSTDNTGSGTAHFNMIPSIVVNKMMRVL